jgi:Cytochrome P460
MKTNFLLLAATAVFAGSSSLWAQVDETVSFPREFRKWATVKSVLVGPQSAAFATEGGIHHIYANDKALEGYDTSKFPDVSVIV